MNIQKTVSKDELRAMRVGQSRVVLLEEATTINSIKVSACTLGKEEGKKFNIRTDYDAPAVCITRTE